MSSSAFHENVLNNYETLTSVFVESRREMGAGFSRSTALEYFPGCIALPNLKSQGSGGKARTENERGGAPNNSSFFVLLNQLIQSESLLLSSSLFG